MVMTQPVNKQILIVEDDEDTAEVVSTLLNEAGYDTLAVDRGEIALYQINQNLPDLVLLDLNLPDIHGLEVLKQVRSQSFLPMIVLSGYGRERDKVTALEAGADDYMAKPFSPEELIARVAALLRRIDWTPQPETKLTVRQLELDIPRRQAFIRGQRLHLTPIEYGLLVTIMRKAGLVVTHDELLRGVSFLKSILRDFQHLRRIVHARHGKHIIRQVVNCRPGATAQHDHVTTKPIPLLGKIHQDGGHAFGKIGQTNCIVDGR
ncbi:MAG TPA: response regulator transcription factor [Phototrophicaceae bacterium]|nr:response regulator transcription factor [Phototrophicaceae bacterium]